MSNCQALNTIRHIRKTDWHIQILVCVREATHSVTTTLFDFALNFGNWIRVLMTLLLLQFQSKWRSSHLIHSNIYCYTLAFICYASSTLWMMIFDGNIKWNAQGVTKYRKWVSMRNRQYVVRIVCVYDAEWSVSLSHYWDVFHGPFFFYSSVATHIEQYSTRATRTHAIIHIQANYNKFSTGFLFSILFCHISLPNDHQIRCTRIKHDQAYKHTHSFNAHTQKKRKKEIETQRIAA